MKGRHLGYLCLQCGREMTTWDERAAKALGYLRYQVCEDCLCREYGVTRDEFRAVLLDYFGMRPCQGL